jgi:ABC-type polysaccharide/polyol phosphate transport system ATPase subunit
MSSKGIAVSVRGVSKAYTIAHNSQTHTTLGEALLHRVKNPLQKIEKETFWALQDINFDINKGEVVGIIGRNGAGKSTLLKILSQITEPTSGKIDLYGRIGSLLEVGTGFHPELTGRENIYLNGAIIGMQKREIDKQFDAIVDFAGVEKFLDTPVKRYSSGMYVRLAFAVAAHLNSEILVIDEVLAVGDAEFQDKCLGKMKDVSNSGRTVLFVSHNMNAIRTLCNRVVGLTNGTCTFVGDTEEGVNLYLKKTYDSSQKIIEFMTKRDKLVEVDSVTINGSPSHIVPISDSDLNLDIEISGSIKQDLKLDMEVWLCDTYNTPLAFFSRGHMTGNTQGRTTGPFTLRHKLQLPEDIHSGNYFLNITLTHHNTYPWAELPQCAQLIVSGKVNPTGQSLRYGDGYGLMSLKEL